jgi:flagellar hook-basal body complex protein FliE
MSTINPSSALGAYKAASQTGALGGSGGIVDQSAKLEGPSFGDVLKTATQSTIDSQKTSEKTSADAVLGKADLTDVVNAVNNAEMTLNLFLAVRDKMIDAYNNITRTQI